MKAPALLLTVLGLILGPGYYLYCEHLSGREAPPLELKERADRWQLADGSIMRFRSGQAYRPVPLDLDPERNLVRLRLSFAMPAAPPSRTDTEYQASLFDLDQPLMQRILRLPAKPGGVHTIVLGTIVVRTPAEHLFVLEEIGNPVLPAAQVLLRVRESVEQPFMPLVWGGVAMLLSGIGLACYALIAGRGRWRGAMRYTATRSPTRSASVHHFPGRRGGHLAALLAIFLAAPAAVAADAPLSPATGQKLKVAQGVSGPSAKAPKAARVRGANKLAALGKKDLPYSPPLSEDEALTALERDVSLKVGKQIQLEDYPEEARRWRWTGTVLIEVLVAGNGIVKQVALSRTSGFRVLDEQALAVVRRVQKVFVPIRLRGRERTVTVPVGFYLQDT